ncbi:Zinc finger and BTB domain-containing protein 7B [Merluccius polli]|uniref:Zinc finger and BTB domain-containing protein 7B n=1 Tax=Merluccius polli TaxID=89951 RepID=A0AA47MF56_MERPO|nr:Zinc finger and BTB domain-containing protein 7B [Merluccius polli]
MPAARLTALRRSSSSRDARTLSCLNVSKNGPWRALPIRGRAAESRASRFLVLRKEELEVGVGQQQRSQTQGGSRRGPRVGKQCNGTHFQFVRPATFSCSEAPDLLCIPVAMSPGEDGLIGIPFPEHSNELLSRLNDQRRAGLLCDLTLTSRGARYPTHRSVMAAVSLYFRRLFGAEEGGEQGGDTGGGGGGGGGGFSVCQLDCVAPDALDALLEFAYTATLTIRSSGMRDVLRAAQLLGIQCVADACRDILGEKEEVVVEDDEEEDKAAEAERAFKAEKERILQWESEMEKVSRRKTDKKKVKKIRLQFGHKADPPTPPVSYPSPLHDGLHSLPSSQPHSPAHEPPHLNARQNGDYAGIPEPEMATTLNGGLHHHHHHHRAIAYPPTAPPSNDKLSESEDLVEDSGMLMMAPSLPSMVEGVGLLPGTGGGGRKRKSQTPQQCPVCQKIIHGAGKLPRHMRTHTGEKPFQCSACGVRFTRYATLTSHICVIYVRDNARRGVHYQKLMDDAEVNDKLKIHMRKHTGERPYPCTHCPARFLHSYDLKNHLSLHSGARPFECPLCHKAFAREDHLQRHRKGHSCLEQRPRRPRRAPGHVDHHDDNGDGGGGEGGEREQSSPPEPLSLQGHSSVFLPRGGNGAGGPPLLLQGGEGERERSLTLQALAQLGPHLQGYPAELLLLRGLGMRAREIEGGYPRGARSPVAQHERWADDDDEEEEMVEGDEDGEE